jgi:hypothetical protein
MFFGADTPRISDMNSSEGFTRRGISEVSHRGEQKIKTIAKSAKSSIATRTKQTANFSRSVIVVCVGFDEFVSTDGTLAFLKVEQLLPIYHRQLKVVKQIFYSGFDIHFT